MRTDDLLIADLAKICKDRRKSLGITQHQLAVLAEVSPRFVYDLERGKATIYLGLFLAVIQALGLQIELPLRKVDF